MKFSLKELLVLVSVFEIGFCELNRDLSTEFITDHSLNNGSVMNISSANLVLSPTTASPVKSSTIRSTENILAIKQWRKTEKVLKKMTSQMLKQILPLVLKASEDLNISSKCSQHLFKMLTGVKQMKTWAFKMLDSYGKIPNGLLDGTISSFGSFEECLNVNVHGHFQGKYCTINLLPPVPPRRPFVPIHSLIPEFKNFSAPDLVVSDFMAKAQAYYFLHFRTSVCMPSTCSKDDVEAIVKKVIADSDIGWEAEVPHCEMKENLPWTTREIIVLCAFGIILMLAFAGTTTDIISTLMKKSEHDSGFGKRFLLCFSLYTNTKKLLKKDDATDTIKVFYGMKVVTTLWVILSHTYYYVNLQVFETLTYSQVMGNDVAFQVICNGFLSVESFFFISAVLVIYGRLISADAEFTVARHIFRRIWRLTPPFMFVIAFSFLLPRMGSGPLWSEIIGTLVDNCKASWWKNLLYINNYVESDKMCMQWMWYIAADTQLYMIALLVIFPIKHYPRVGIFSIIAIFATGFIWTAVSNVVHRLHPTAIYAYPNPEDANYFINHGYFQTHLHTASYCVGMIVGYILATRQKLKIPLHFNIMGWVVSLFFGSIVVFGTYEWNQGNVPSLAVSTLYTCTNKLAFATALGWVTVACFTGNGGIVTSILSWPAFVPISRLTYMTYLVHPILQHMYMGSIRVVLQIGHRTLAYLYLGHVVMAYIVAYFCSQLFESPFMAMERLFVPRVKRKSEENDQPKIEQENTFKPHSYINCDENGIYATKIKMTEPPV